MVSFLSDNNSNNRCLGGAVISAATLAAGKKVSTPAITNPYSNTVVQTKSIHSSLSLLSKNVEDLRRQTLQCQAKHQQLSRELQQRYRPQQQQLLEQMRQARESAGKAVRQAHNLTHQEHNLKGQLKQESQQLKQAFEEEKILLQQEADQQRKYVQDMWEFNRELNSLLKAREQDRMLVRLEGLALAVADSNENDGDGDNGSELQQLWVDLLLTGGRDGDREEQESPQEEEEDQVVGAVNTLWEAARLYQKMVQEKASWQDKVDRMRGTVLKHAGLQQGHSPSLLDPPITEASLRELERVWEGTWNKEDDKEEDTTTVTAEHMHPQGSDKDSGNTKAAMNNPHGGTMKERGGNCGGGGGGSTEQVSASGGGGDQHQPAPVHMQLFYDTTTAIGEDDEEEVEGTECNESGDMAMNLGF